MKKLITPLISLLCVGAVYSADTTISQLTEPTYTIAAGDRIVVKPTNAGTLNSVSTTISGEGTIYFGKNGTNNDWGNNMTLNVVSSFTNGQYRLDGARVLTVNKVLDASTGVFQLLNTNAKMIFNANATIARLNAYGGGQIYVNDGATLTFKAGANIANNASKIVINNGGVLNMNTSGDATVKYSYLGNCDFILGWKDTPGISFVVEKGGVANIGAANSVKNNLGLHNSGIITLRGTLNVANVLRMFNGSTLVADGGTLNTSTYAEAASDFYIANYYTATSGGTDYKFNDAITTVNLKVVNTSTLGTIHMHDTTGLSVAGTEKGTSLIIDFSGMAEGATLTIKDFAGITEDAVSRMVTLKNYIDGSMFVETELAKNADGTLVGIFDSNRNSLYQWDNGKISLTQIPEPAEWAAILGALAIAFVFMRRQTRN